ncbi:hypothetical protein NLJ89_g9889 [Agrocybe chaxingu]|uniref:DOMON domain-containing protein n=1 Tax=Agrocybe chaxingu TaxID=84603 RepID=A0A9W8JSD0_9AGAR|nr:hypothetical protein NLJ89_g9889 [Agrocybe chaxingu]
MFSFLMWALGPVLLALYASAQTTRWCDSLTNVCFTSYYYPDLDTTWGYAFPPLPAAGQTPSDEFIGIFVGPSSLGWIGNSLGNGMRQNPLIVAWTDGNTPRASVRFTSNYSPPPVYSGPTVTVLGASGVNATHQRIVFRCQRCTTWTGGSNGIGLNGVSTFGYALHGTIKPLTPSDPGSSLYQHTMAGLHTIDVSQAHDPLYNNYLTTLQNAPPVLPPSLPSTTTTPIPTPTGPLQCPGAPQPTYALMVADGWRATPVLGRLSSPRGITIDTMGNLLVLQRGRGLTGHRLDANGCVTSTTTIISDTAINHAIEVHPDGNRIFASSSDVAWSWDYNPSTMTATNRRTLVTGMNNNYHFTRTILIPKRNPDYMVVNVGSDGNLDWPTFHPAAGRAQIRVFDLRTLPANGVPFTSGRVFGYGLRNHVGIAEDRGGTVYSIENSLDDAYRTINGQRRDVHNDNPAEKVYRLGNPSAPTGFWGGYPYCFTVWEPNSFIDKTFQVGDWFVQAPNATLTDAWCDNNAVKPIALLPPHTAPLDIKFGVGSDTNLYVPMHGSWNRNPPQGYKVVIVPGTYSASGEWSPTVGLAQTKTTWSDLLRNRAENSCNAGCFRPVGLVFSANGENIGTPAR